MTHTLTMLIIALAFAVNAVVLSIVLRMRRYRDRPPRIIVKEVPVIKEVKIPIIREVIRKPPRLEEMYSYREVPRRIEAEISDEYMRSRFHERD